MCLLKIRPVSLDKSNIVMQTWSDGDAVIGMHRITRNKKMLIISLHELGLMSCFTGQKVEVNCRELASWCCWFREKPHDPLDIPHDCTELQRSELFLSAPLGSELLMEAAFQSPLKNRDLMMRNSSSEANKKYLLQVTSSWSCMSPCHCCFECDAFRWSLRSEMMRRVKASIFESSAHKMCSTLSLFVLQSWNLFL